MGSGDGVGDVKGIDHLMGSGDGVGGMQGIAHSERLGV